MKALLLNPYFWLGVLLAALGLFGGGYYAGHRAAKNACASGAARATAKVERAEDVRDANIDAIAAATSSAVTAALNQNQATTDESTDRIRTVVVPGPCRDVDPVILRELRDEAERINAALGVGVRPDRAEASSAPARRTP